MDTDEFNKNEKSMMSSYAQSLAKSLNVTTEQVVITNFQRITFQRRLAGQTQLNIQSVVNTNDQTELLNVEKKATSPTLKTNLQNELKTSKLWQNVVVSFIRSDAKGTTNTND